MSRSGSSQPTSATLSSRQRRWTTTSSALNVEPRWPEPARLTATSAFARHMSASSASVSERVSPAAARSIEDVLRRIPDALAKAYHVEVLVIDDSSGDQTFERGQDVRTAHTMPFKLHVLYNPVNQGYGGNQKIGFHFAIERDFDFVALLHGDGQYAPERLPELVKPLADGAADAVFGSRMLTRGGARRGGMPRYKFLGNKILSWLQ